MQTYIGRTIDKITLWYLTNQSINPPIKYPGISLYDILQLV